MENILTEEKYEEIWKSMNQLSQLISKDIGRIIKLSCILNMDAGGKRFFEIISDPLPESFFGIFSKMIVSAKICSWGSTIRKSGTIVFNPHFSYKYYEGGSNGSAIYDGLGHPLKYKYINNEWVRNREWYEKTIKSGSF